MRRILILAGLLLALPAHADTMLNDGMFHYIDDPTASYDWVIVRNAGCPPGWPAVPPGDPCPSPGTATQVEVARRSDGLPVLAGLSVFDSSNVTFSGGAVDGGLTALDSSSVTINRDFAAPHMIHSWMYVADSATAMITGGFVPSLDTYYSPKVTLSGGRANQLTILRSARLTICGGEAGEVSVDGPPGKTPHITMSGGVVTGNLGVSGSAIATLTGGTMASLSALESSVTMSGGTVDHSLSAGGSSVVKISGGTVGDDLIAYDSSTISVVGSSFAVDGVPVPYGNLSAMTGILTGTLASGESLNNRFYQGAGSYTGTITLSPATEVCSDGVDNDDDGFIDFPNDPGCDDVDDRSERSLALVCDNGLDDDCDGGIDFDPETFANPGDETTLPSGFGDPGCKDPTSSTESPQCQDGINNDHWAQDPNPGHVDYDAGYSTGSRHPNGPDPQCVGKPWKNQERKDYPCGLGIELALLLLPLMWLCWRRTRRL